MAVCSSRTRSRRRWFLTLSLVAAGIAVTVGVLLWQVVEFSSLSTVTARVNQLRSISDGLRLLLIGALAMVWPWILSLRVIQINAAARMRWMALRWRVVGWLLVIELVIGQKLLDRVFHLVVNSV